MAKFKINFLIVVFALALISSDAKAWTFAEAGNWLKNDISLLWCEHNYDVYIPFYAWHNRLTYDDEHIEKYNENSWGLGFGISKYDSNSNWSGLYGMAFKDSNYHPETYFGYAHQWNWTAGENNDWRAGVGYALGITQRQEYAFIPVPLPLPLFGVGYKNVNFHAAYVPGVKNDGNVLFVFSRIEF